MSCPFLEEKRVRFCRAFPIRKMIPSGEGEGQTESTCSNETYVTCQVFQDSGGKKETPLLMGSQRKDCVWQKQSIISFRLCTLDYQCERCQFEQSLQERNGQYVEPPEMVEAIQRMRRMPGHLRRCKYMLMSPVKAEPCLHDYKCSECPKYQEIREAVHKGS